MDPYLEREEHKLLKNKVNQLFNEKIKDLSL